MGLRAGAARSRRIVEGASLPVVEMVVVEPPVATVAPEPRLLAVELEGLVALRRLGWKVSSGATESSRLS